MRKTTFVWTATLAMMVGVAGSTILANKGNWRKFQDPNSAARGNCPECGAGEAKVEVTMRVPHGVYVDVNNPPCGAASFNSVTIPDPLKAAAALAFYAQDGGSLSGQLAHFALGLGDQIANLIVAAGVNNAGEIGRFTRGITNQPQVSNCVRLVAVLPQEDVEITRITQTNDCPGWCGWVSEPRTDRIDENLFGVVTVAKNWSHDTDRTATLKVYYRR
jgi:hypothetical protein